MEWLKTGLTNEFVLILLGIIGVIVLALAGAITGDKALSALTGLVYGGSAMAVGKVARNKGGQ